ncbi:MULTISPECIES: 2,3-diaminopropionate biosynthesis protein SbnA [Actinomadura]|uniref:Cysteine synthase A n=1 Tax=Actinomadura madurae TaxID=1993 RepID=A0A1I5AE87_9ACTN|nr:2,3-diaminopropionate biosynthesis protein SbnA [Actinomadura madurae]MCP9948756.1 2,3-diaminopropionate biosynthesis protein SbnA [Actinomadura madurae]MCP9965534.1 2,3-diaminopropionate biosynthesis protein SbnA [Actinomadura madurae]MCP9978015.1 2,3-diaminopropionate biosynthesis protein SbnA [Actinomadura madurae]MCQ0014208.1 2,3-diaminopropionate biosynthesis protein SbnA [Actinomadura madurae]URM94373.1 2,3-diaminopropionate biosynthesis protein SbnA [Actinomadura madurae]
MPIITSPQDFNVDDLYVDLRHVIERPLYLKCEGFNFAGSVKLKAAAAMVEAAVREGAITPESIIVESSSGNLGIALSLIAASRGLRFVCVTDPRCNPASMRVMRALGAEVRVVSGTDANGGYLGGRIRYVQELCAEDARYVWLNQYANRNNWLAHYSGTAPSIDREFPDLEVLFVGAGTTGTLMGCARYFREHRRPVTIVAVDAVGSVTFGGIPERRMVPGLGTSSKPALVDEAYIDDVVHVPETDTIRTVHALAARGFLFGGSTGTVVSGASRWLAEKYPGEDPIAVAIAPDLGERYLDSLYEESWVREHFGDLAAILGD